MQAKKHGLLAKIDTVLDTTFESELESIRGKDASTALPNMQQWSGWDEEKRAMFVDDWIIATNGTISDFTNAMSNQGMGQLQRTEWLLGPQLRN